MAYSEPAEKETTVVLGFAAASFFVAPTTEEQILQKWCPSNKTGVGGLKPSTGGALGDSSAYLLKVKVIDRADSLPAIMC